MTAHIVDFLCTKHVMGAIKHIPWVIENKARTHRKKKRTAKWRWRKLWWGEEIRYGEEYRHWAGVIIHLTFSSEFGSSLVFAMQPTQSALDLLQFNANFFLTLHIFNDFPICDFVVVLYGSSICGGYCFKWKTKLIFTLQIIILK